MVRWILASKSPRRIKLLKERGLVFEVCPSGLEEWDGVESNPESLALHLARDKARAVARRFENEEAVILAADTIVVIDGKVLGQPRTPAEARGMLARLSGRVHQVITGVVLRRADTAEEAQASCLSRVILRPIPRPEIASYVAGGECLDKAGSYAVQGQGARFVTRITGPYDNVVGLPVDCVARLADKLNVPFPSASTRKEKR